MLGDSCFVVVTDGLYALYDEVFVCVKVTDWFTVYLYIVIGTIRGVSVYFTMTLHVAR